MRYRVQPLGQFIDIISGYAFKSKDFKSTGIPVIKIKNVTPPEVSLVDLSYIPIEIADSLPKFELSYGDVLIALTGSHINQMASVVGRVARVKYYIRSMLNQRVGKIVVKDKDVCDLEYVYYYLSQDQVKISLASKAGGAANQANISPTDVKELEIPLPPIEIQRRISDILSAYDDLIENNQKQIKLLEEAAMRLYKEWFVKLRFPGYENTKIVNGVPEGWELSTVKGMGQVITGKTPSTAIAENYGKDIPFVKIPDMHDVIYPLKTEVKLSERGANTQKNKFLPPKSIMVSCIATVGLVCITHEVCQTNQQINSIVLNDEDHLYYMFFKMKGIKSLLEGVGSNGATMTNVNKTKFENIELLKPENEILKKFNNLVEPFFSNILALSKQNEKLKEARDKLLSKLMSGEIEV